MIIQFQTIPSVAYPNFRGGKHTVYLKRVTENSVTYIEGVIPPNASIGLHMHVGETETIRILAGTATLLLNSEEFRLSSGDVHVCPEGATHSLCNDTNEDVVFFGIIQ